MCMWQRESGRGWRARRRTVCEVADSSGRRSCRHVCYRLFLWEMECGNYGRDERGAGGVSLWPCPTPAYLNFHLAPLNGLAFWDANISDRKEGGCFMLGLRSIISNTKNHKTHGSYESKVIDARRVWINEWEGHIVVKETEKPMQPGHFVLSNKHVTWPRVSTAPPPIATGSKLHAFIFWMVRRKWRRVVHLYVQSVVFLIPRPMFNLHD